VCGPDDDVDKLQDDVMGDLQTVLSKVDKSGQGVYVQASTLGALEALLQFLADKKVPVSGIAIGPVHKKDVTKASVMLAHRSEYATILAFDVKVDPEATRLAGLLLLPPARPSHNRLCFKGSWACACSRPTSSTTCLTR